MPTNRERVLAYLADHPEGCDDDQIGAALLIDRIQINQICHRLADAGALRRGKPAGGGKITNWPNAVPGSDAQPPAVPPHAPGAGPVAPLPVLEPVAWLADGHALHQFAYAGTVALSEDQVTSAIKQVLEACGWQTEVRYGHVRGIDIEAVRGDQRVVLEAKGEGLHDQARGNYFVGALGELLQRMKAPDVRYGLALPAHRRFVGLVERLPLWVRQRLGLWFFFVRPSGDGLEVGVYPPDASIGEL